MKQKFDLQTLLKLDIKDLGNYFRGNAVQTKTNKPKKKKASLKHEAIVFDLGATMIQVIVGRFTNQKLVIKHAFHLPMPSGCLEDGKILNESRLATTLADAISHRKIKAKHAIVTMNSSQIINRDLFIPVVETEELETVIRFELQQYLPINLADYQIRYILTDEQNEEGKMRVFVSAFPERMLRAYYQMLNQADFHPYALELPLIALRKTLQHTNINAESQINEQTVAFLDIGQENINISIYDQGNIDFTRLIRNGGQVIDEALRREGIKHDQVIDYKHEQLNVSAADFAQALPDVKQSLDQLINEVEKFLQFYRNNNQTKTLSAIYVYGGCAQIQGLAPYLETIFKVPTQIIETFDNVELQDKTEQSKTMTSYVNALSSLIRVEE